MHTKYGVSDSESAIPMGNLDTPKTIRDSKEVLRDGISLWTELSEISSITANGVAVAG